MEAFNTAALKIIQEQYRVIGPLAVEQARMVSGLTVDDSVQHATITGDASRALGLLVKQYEAFFGQTSVEVCRDAARETLQQIPKTKVPPVLR